MAGRGSIHSSNEGYIRIYKDMYKIMKEWDMPQNHLHIPHNVVSGLYVFRKRYCAPRRT